MQKRGLSDKHLQKRFYLHTDDHRISFHSCSVRKFKNRELEHLCFREFWGVPLHCKYIGRRNYCKFSKNGFQKSIGLLNPNYFKKQHFCIIIFTLPYIQVCIQVQNGHGVLSSLVPCNKCMKLCCLVLYGHFGPVYLLLVCKNDNEKRFFLK